MVYFIQLNALCICLILTVLFKVHVFIYLTFTLRSNVKVTRASLVAEMVKSLPSVQEAWVRSLGQEDPLEKGMATHSSILAWEVSWTEEPGRLQTMCSQKVGHNGMTNFFFPRDYTIYHKLINVTSFLFSKNSIDLYLPSSLTKYWTGTFCSFVS